MECGEQCVILAGTTPMLKWHADNSVTLKTVSYYAHHDCKAALSLCRCHFPGECCIWSGNRSRTL